MMPIAHVIARRRHLQRRQDASLRVKNTPYTTPPRVGLYDISTSEPLHPKGCVVQLDVNDRQTTYHIRMSYRVTAGSSPFAFFFPVNDCGQVAKITVMINDIPMSGEMIRRSRRDPSRLISAQNRGEFLKTDSDEEDEREQAGQHKKGGRSSGGSASGMREPTVFYFYVPGASLVVFGPAGPKKDSPVIVQVTVITTTLVDTKDHLYRAVFPLTCVPCPPASVSAEISMPKLVRRVTTPNSNVRIQQFLNNTKAEVALERSQPASSPAGGEATPLIRLEDFLLVIQVELGSVIEPECMDPVSMLVLVVALSLAVFFALTNDLDYYE